MKLINSLLALCVSSGLVYWWATTDYAPNQNHEGMNAQVASVSPNDLVRSSPLFDTQETQSLPVVSLYRYLPGAYAEVLNSCNVTRELAPRLRPIISELANKKFDDDFSSLADDLRTEELKENPDAWAILGLLHEEHLVPDVDWVFTEATVRRLFN